MDFNVDPNLMKQAKAFFHGTQALCNFVDQKIVPIVNGIISPNDHDQSIQEVFYRMQYWLLALDKLDHPQHFQIVMNAARATYELLLDLKQLIKDPAQTDKYRDFSFVARFVAAKKYADALVKYPATPPPLKAPGPDRRTAFVSDAGNQANFDLLCKKHSWIDKHGKSKAPEHWTGKTMPDRAESFGPAEYLRYRQLFAQFSWFVHSGSAGTLGIGPDGLLAAFTYGHGHIQFFISEGIELICDAQKLFIANPNLRDDFDKAKVEMGRHFQSNP